MQAQGSEVSFPLGGIGAGCVGLRANGEFIDWEIFNSPNKGSRLGQTHLCVRALDDSGTPQAVRVLHGDAYPPYSGDLHGKFGHGVPTETLAGLPHFRDVSFEGKFPMAHLDFADGDFPARVSLRAWSVFIPGDSEISSLPVACLELAFTNDTERELTYSGVFCLCNHFPPPHARNRLERSGTRTYLRLTSDWPESDLQYGELVASTDCPEISAQEYLFQGNWSDIWEVYWHDLCTHGKLPPRTYPNPHPTRLCAGALEAQVKAAPGETTILRFLLSWHFPNRQNDWSEKVRLDQELAAVGLTNRWRNYYATRWPDARAVADAVLDRYSELHSQVATFTQAFYATTIPQEAIDGAGANLSILVSPTCLRLEDGTFYGWEGVNARTGSCEGSCQHVWNYAQALSLLFPDLERSMRLAHLKYGLDEHGGLHFRLKLPLGLQATSKDFRCCVDGGFGEILKCYREWRISGDDAFLRKCYPALQQVLAYAWSPDNYDRWDPERTGVMTGRQHHTLDAELFGPNAWLEGHYLGALLAMSIMAQRLGDLDCAKEYQKMFEQGRKWTRDNLFDGDHFIQKIDLSDREQLRPYRGQPMVGDADDGYDAYWDEEHAQIKYQIGEGVGIDMPLAQAYADLYGLGDVLDRDQVQSTLKAIFRRNFRRRMRDYPNTWRIYALNDEGGTIICTWPRQESKPVIPIAYNSEVMAGFEWMFAVNLVLNGMLAEAKEVIHAIRDRYDGRKRNPWNEIECGSNYARSMASYGLLQAYSGFQYDMITRSFSFSPRLDGPFRTFWSIGTAWGTWERLANGARCLTVLHGSLELHSLDSCTVNLKLTANQKYEY
ncbi:MAG: hypothetical protein IJJ33_20215 [Victivallales bacterium]|nr:hypothetical protein [Victivallales bacterium]